MPSENVVRIILVTLAKGKAVSDGAAQKKPENPAFLKLYVLIQLADDTVYEAVAV